MPDTDTNTLASEHSIEAQRARITFVGRIKHLPPDEQVEQFRTLLEDLTNALMDTPMGEHAASLYGNFIVRQATASIRS